jgi:3-phosphoshikimate 1-carboxyvinyltransferase
LGVPFHFTGLQTLRIKETDRIDALQREMLKLGYPLQVTSNSELSWDGEILDSRTPELQNSPTPELQNSPTPELQNSRTPELLNPAIDTYDDHRMALAFAPLAMRYGSIYINNPEVVSKSYPNFWDDLRAAGFEVTVQQTSRRVNCKTVNSPTE